MSKRKVVWYIILIVIAFAVLSVFVTYVSMCSRVATAPARVANRVLDEDNIIQNYEWYHDAYNKCLAYDQQIGNALMAYDSHVKDMQRESYADKTEKARLNSIVLGLRNQRADLVKQYNSRSAQLTRNKFKGWSLPFNLEVINDSTKEIVE